MRETNVGNNGADGAQAPAVGASSHGQRKSFRRRMVGSGDPKVAGSGRGRPCMIAGDSYWLRYESTEPLSFEGAELLAQSGRRGKAPTKLARARHGRALFQLRTGDFFAINSGAGELIQRFKFPDWLADMGCPWDLTKQQAVRIAELNDAILEENRSMVF